MKPTPTAIQPFVDRLALRSTLTKEEEFALIGLTGQIAHYPADAEFVRSEREVSHASLVVEGLVGRFGVTSAAARQISCLYIAGDMADLSSTVSPKAAWGLVALSRTTILQIPHAALRSIAASQPGLAEAFWRDSVADSSVSLA